MLRVIVTYDVSNNKARRKISERCLDYGLDRAQYSVFSGLLRPTNIRALSKALQPYVKSGHVLIIPIASDDWEKRIELGAPIHHRDEEDGDDD
ncbi:MAG: CRISPR-associated endonuclease Cas2 [Anaerolineae bacterium]|nr:CRISPR-associated endonuclease Cas2 [Anaerolineae bacterium]MDW8170920.1 CRISPR-associated endonuclease Cas2 [Anaerolineae bacterium]